MKLYYKKYTITECVVDVPYYDYVEKNIEDLLDEVDEYAEVRDETIEYDELYTDQMSEEDWQAYDYEQDAWFGNHLVWPPS